MDAEDVVHKGEATYVGDDQDPKRREESYAGYDRPDTRFGCEHDPIRQEEVHADHDRTKSRLSGNTNGVQKEKK